MFAATFLGTLERSYSERAMYAAGSEVRLERFSDYQITKSTLQEKYAELSGIDKASFAYRVKGRVGTMFTETPLTLLGIDADNLADISWYREDFSEKSLPVLMDVLTEDNPIEQGFELPEGTESLGVWVYPELGNPIIRAVSYTHLTLPTTPYV